MKYFTNTNISNEEINIRKQLVEFNIELEIISKKCAWVSFADGEFRFHHLSIVESVSGHNPEKYYDVLGKYENNQLYFNESDNGIFKTFVVVKDIEVLFSRMVNSLPIKRYLMAVEKL